MPDESRTDNIEKLLSDEKAIEDRRKALIADLLKQKEAAVKEFDDKLAKLGYRADRAGKSKRSHHKQALAAGVDAAAKPKVRA